MRKLTFYSKLTIAKETTKFSQFVSKAAQEDALTDLRKLLPDQQEIDTCKDLQFFAANSAVANLVNLNSVGILADTAVKMQPSWKRKPVNMGHDRTHCIGYITDSGFSTYGDNKVISAQEALLIDGPVNLTVSGIIWKIAGYGFESELLNDCDNPESPYFHDMSISWEVGFDDYHIALGTKNLSKATILRDPESIKEHTKYLLGEENEDGSVGTGFMRDGTEVYMIVASEPIVLGIGITSAPAAAVKGIVVTPSKVLAEASSSVSTAPLEIAAEIVKLEEKPIEAEIKTEIPKNQYKISKKVEKSENSLSQTQKTTVKPFNIMSKFTIESLFQRLTESGVTLPEQRALQDFLDESISEGAKEYTAKLTAASDALENSKRESTEVREKLTVAETELTTLKAKLAELEEKVELEQRQTILASRIDELSEKYDLSKASVKKAVVKQIKDLSDADYATWLKDDEVGGVLLASHLKQETPVDVEEATKALKQTQASVTFPNAQDVEKSLDLEKLINAFTK